MNRNRFGSKISNTENFEVEMPNLNSKILSNWYLTFKFDNEFELFICGTVKNKNIETLVLDAITKRNIFTLNGLLILEGNMFSCCKYFSKETNMRFYQGFFDGWKNVVEDEKLILYKIFTKELAETQIKIPDHVENVRNSKLERIKWSNVRKEYYLHPLYHFEKTFRTKNKEKSVLPSNETIQQNFPIEPTNLKMDTNSNRNMKESRNLYMEKPYNTYQNPRIEGAALFKGKRGLESHQQNIFPGSKTNKNVVDNRISSTKYLNNTEYPKTNDINGKGDSCSDKTLSDDKKLEIETHNPIKYDYKENYYKNKYAIRFHINNNEDQLINPIIYHEIFGKNSERDFDNTSLLPKHNKSEPFFKGTDFLQNSGLDEFRQKKYTNKSSENSSDDDFSRKQKSKTKTPSKEDIFEYFIRYQERNQQNNEKMDDETGFKQLLKAKEKNQQTSTINNNINHRNLGENESTRQKNKANIYVTKKSHSEILNNN